MNFVLLSPHFPPNYHLFAVRLHEMGVNVLGLAEEAYDNLNDNLKSHLTEYYRVNDMHNYDELVRALGYFTHKYGKINRIESHNEYWLETEAKLRTDFNIFGIKNDQIDKIKQKSEMKKTFIKAQISAAKGELVEDLGKALKFIDAVGYPVIAKPDIGVGAYDTFKIHDKKELKQFFDNKPDVVYFMEEFIDGIIQSFDGLTDQDGNIVFYTVHQYSTGVINTVIKDKDIYYYSLRDIPTDIKDAGTKTLRAFNIKERFFHLEFFRTADNKLIALEVNMRPPGGMTTDMFNYANDIDIYKEYANVVSRNIFEAKYTRLKHCLYAGRKTYKNYLHSTDEIYHKFKNNIVHRERLSGAFSPVLGDLGILLCSPKLDEIISMAEYIQAVEE
ncbi:MAG: ATP-grasp domain-containing protein [Pseudomonadota bacterium]